MPFAEIVHELLGQRHNALYTIPSRQETPLNLQTTSDQAFCVGDYYELAQEPYGSPWKDSSPCASL